MGEGQRLRGSNRTRAPAGLPGVWAAAPRQGSVFNAGKVCAPAKTRPHGEDPAYNRRTGSRREERRLAAEAVRAMTARTTQPRPSKGPLGGRGRCLGEGPGVVPLGAMTRRGAVPIRAACLYGRTPWHGEGGRPTRTGGRGRTGGSVRPPRPPGRGTPPLTGARLQPDWGKPNVRLIGGPEETSASRLRPRGARRLRPTRHAPSTALIPLS